MNIKKTGAAFGAAAIIGTALVAAGPALSASAHTGHVTATCQALVVDLSNYQLKPEISHVVHHDAVTKTVVDKEAYDETIIDEPAVEAKPAVTHTVHHEAVTHEEEVPAVTHEETVPATYKTVHHDAVTHTETKVVTPAYDETVIDSPAVPAKDAVPAVYGEKPLISPAVPAQPAVPAVTHNETLWKNVTNGKTQWVKDGAQPPKGFGWVNTHECRTVVDVPAKPAVPGKDAVYGDAPLITPAQPAVPAQPEVSHVVHHEAVTEEVTVVDQEAYDEQVVDVPEHTVTIIDTPATTKTVVDKEAYDEVIVDEPAVEAKPAVTHVEHHDAVTHEETVTEAYDETVVDSEADATPNTVSIHVGDQTESEEFGTSFTEVVKLDSTKATPYTVDVVAWDDPTGANGWTFQTTGTTKACTDDGGTPPVVTPPTDGNPPVVTPPVVTPPKPETPVVTVPVVVKPITPAVAGPKHVAAVAPTQTRDTLAFTGVEPWMKPAGIGGALAVLAGLGTLVWRSRRAQHRAE